MIRVNELGVTKTGTQIRQNEAQVILGRLTKKTETGADRPDGNDQLDKKPQPFPAICMCYKQCACENQRPKLADKAPRLKRIRTDGSRDIVDSSNGLVRPG